MDILLNFTDTRAVLQAEQILIRRKIPFETVPKSRYFPGKCGLGILCAKRYEKAARSALKDAHISAKFTHL
jgi:hypothetical protein